MFSSLLYDTSTSSFINKPPRNSAVQIAAAITAHARSIYTLISAERIAYYTDTDSIVRSKKLPEDVISPSILGKFKLKYQVKEGIFLAPKSDCLIPHDGAKDILVHKGAAKQHVSGEGYINQYKNQEHFEKVTVTNPFAVDLKSMSIRLKDSFYCLRSTHLSFIWFDSINFKLH